MGPVIAKAIYLAEWDRIAAEWDRIARRMGPDVAEWDRTLRQMHPVPCRMRPDPAEWARKQRAHSAPNETGRFFFAGFEDVPSETSNSARRMRPNRKSRDYKGLPTGLQGSPSGLQ